MEQIVEGERLESVDLSLVVKEYALSQIQDSTLSHLTHSQIDYLSTLHLSQNDSLLLKLISLALSTEEIEQAKALLTQSQSVIVTYNSYTQPLLKVQESLHFNQDLVICKMTVNGKQVVFKRSPSAVCSQISANGSVFQQQISVEDLVPKNQDEQVECPIDYDRIYYVDDQSLQLSCFSTITTQYISLFDLTPFLQMPLNSTVVFTNLQVRINH
jgi:hypothetical protein